LGVTVVCDDVPPGGLLARLLTADVVGALTFTLVL
jgi:hypothetical protein